MKPKKNITVDRPQWTSYLQIIQHALKGGLRAFGLGLGIKGGMSFFLHIISIFSKPVKGSRLSERLWVACKQSFLGKDNLRFTAMISSFTFLWKLINNSLMFYYKKEGPSKSFGAISGGIAASIAICFETEENRVGYAQQFFVRSLQAWINARKMRKYPTMKNGDAFIFISSCCWILYAFCFHQDTLPRVYLQWLSNRAGIPSTSLDLHKIHACDSFGLTSNCEEIMETVGITENNLSKLHNCIKRTGGKLAEFPCLFFHPNEDSCVIHSLMLFARNMREMAPVYFSLTAIPMAVFNPSKLFTHTKHQLLRIFMDNLTSSIFISSLITSMQAGLCLYTHQFPTLKTKNLIIPLALISSCAIFIEQKRKRAELAMFVLPKALQSLYLTMIEKRFLRNVPGLEIVGSALSMSILMSLYHENQGSDASLLYKVMKRVLGMF